MSFRLADLRRQISQIPPELRRTLLLLAIGPTLLWIPVIWTIYADGQFMREILALGKAAKGAGVSEDVLRSVHDSGLARLRGWLALLVGVFLLGSYGAIVAVVTLLTGRMKTQVKPSAPSA